MSLNLRRTAAALSFLVATVSPALAFDAPGPWDSRPLDASNHEPALVDAQISAARAFMAAGSNTKKNNATITGTQATGSCTQSIASTQIPSGSSGQTVILQADIHNSTIIQVCH